MYMFRVDSRRDGSWHEKANRSDVVRYAEGGRAANYGWYTMPADAVSMPEKKEAVTELRT